MKRCSVISAAMFRILVASFACFAWLTTLAAAKDPPRVQAPLSRLARFGPKTRGDGFGREVKQRIMLGTFALSSGYYDAYYGQAVAMKRKIRHDFHAAFEKADVVICPTAPTPA